MLPRIVAADSARLHSHAEFVATCPQTAYNGSQGRTSTCCGIAVISLLRGLAPIPYMQALRPSDWRTVVPFRYSLNSSTIRPTPILDKIRVAAAAGYEAIELWHDDIDRHLQSGGMLGEIRQAIDDHGLAVPTTIMLKGWCEPDGPAHAQGWGECRRRLEQAAAVGSRHAIAGPPLGSVDYALAAQRYGELVDLGLTYNVRAAMEYLGFAQEVNSIAKAHRIMQESGHPQATIVLDPFHDYRGGAGCEEIARLRADEIAICHFDDAPANPPAHEQKDGDRVLPGDGVIPLRRFLALLRQIGYSGWVSLELFREDLWQRDPLEVAQLGLAKMRAVCEADERFVG